MDPQTEPQKEPRKKGATLVENMTPVELRKRISHLNEVIGVSEDQIYIMSSILEKIEPSTGPIYRTTIRVDCRQDDPRVSSLLMVAKMGIFQTSHPKGVILQRKLEG